MFICLWIIPFLWWWVKIEVRAQYFSTLSTHKEWRETFMSSPTCVYPLSYEDGGSTLRGWWGTGRHEMLADFLKRIILKIKFNGFQRFQIVVGI